MIGDSRENENENENEFVARAKKEMRALLKAKLK